MPWPHSRPAEDHRRLEARPALGLILAGAAVATAGFAVAGPTLAVPGIALALAGAGALAWVLLAGWGVAISLTPVRDTVVEGEMIVLALGLGSRRRPARGSMRLHHELLEAPVSLGEADPGRAGRHRPLTLQTRARGRGRVRLGAGELEISDPFALARRHVRSPGPGAELLVLPRVDPVRWHGPRPGLTGREAGAARRGGRAGLDLIGLRDYQPGTPATRIHWPSLARGGTLLERVFAEETESAPRLVLDGRRRDGGDGPDYEALIRAVASLTVALARAGGVELWLPGRPLGLTVTPALAGWPAAHRALALAGRSDGPTPVASRTRDGVWIDAGVRGGTSAEAVIALRPRELAAGLGAAVLCEVAECVAVEVAPWR